MKVYLAGKVTKPDGTYDDWRTHLVGSVIPAEVYIGPNPELDGNKPRSSRPGSSLNYAKHAEQGIKECDVLIAVLNSGDCYNTLVEIGYAAALKKTIAVWSPGVGTWPSSISEFRSVLHWASVYDRGIYTLEEFVRRCLKIESPIEWMLFGALCDFPLRVTPQFEIGRYRADFLMDDSNICVEIDGHEHHKTKEQRTRDARREREIERAGFQVVRFTGSEVFRDAHQCVEEIYEVYSEYTANGSGE